MSSQLTGIRILDFCQYAPGPFATRELMSRGAEVIKIEPPNGDPMAHMLCKPGEISTAYGVLNAGKQIVRGDLKQASFLETVRTLIADADALVEGFRPGVMDRLGLGYTDCQSLNQRLVYCSISGYGQTGPWSTKAGHDINYCAAAGIYSYGHQSLFPLVADHSGAQSAVTEILAALLQRERTGQGARLDIALYAPMLRWQYMMISDRQWDKNHPLSLLAGGAACYQIYRTRDLRDITLGALEPVFWKNFCEAVRRPDWIDRHMEPLPQTNLIQSVAELIGSRDLDDLNALMSDIDCCVEPVPNAREIFDHPQTRHRAEDQWFGQSDNVLNLQSTPAWNT